MAILFPAFTVLIYIYYAFAKREQEAHKVELHQEAAKKTSPNTTTISYSQGYAVTTTTRNGGLLIWVHWLRFVIVEVLAGYILY
ncbi:hypothetical protein BGZ83_003692 [Gryganskiella cystojenkinii]|nr:hypothetical protein BGZ83_003692 [Gryganskiella cystojenkinii]